MQLPLFNWLYCRNVSCSLDAVNTPWRWVLESLDASSALYLKVWNLSAPWGQIPLPSFCSQGWLHKEECNTTPALCTPLNELFGCCFTCSHSVTECRKGKPSATVPSAAFAQFRWCRCSLAFSMWSEGDSCFWAESGFFGASGGVVCPETGVHLWISSHVFTLLFLTT